VLGWQAFSVVGTGGAAKQNGLCWVESWDIRNHRFRFSTIQELRIPKNDGFEWINITAVMKTVHIQ
jgi:hypothetical protein